MIADRIRSMGQTHWLMLFGGIALAWVVLWLMSVPAEMRALSRVYGADFWESLCTVTPDAAGFARVLLMWALMSAAMMAPTALPAFATYDDLRHSGAETDFGKLVAGYLTVWLGFAVIAAGAQMALFLSGAVDALGQSQSRWLTAGLLIVAGGYQFSALKEACLSKCRHPVTFFMAHYEEGPWRNGLRLGAVCLGCCWALMMLAFVGGVMSLAFMALATVLMIFEKLPDIGRYLTRPLGVALIGAGFWVAL
ncbi:DUF2182 domain-containing protein [Primorskyibacter aestuariivivens]|uniref:DUF2182 domain-containing protein n=1 Tax=Primorskyibacter aestuariivivens TaxID=1888912 RepID=UPI002300EB35|nr:DUF2182 domain-containing protein [Primorskyibacter aestuariivivens]MDA7429858.1 DUF2182 domain-containing protein [Primorskyibacter aestuariivivens]